MGWHLVIDEEALVSLACLLGGSFDLSQPGTSTATGLATIASERFALDGASVVDVMNCIHTHPFGADDICGDPVVHPDYVRKIEGRYRVFLENHAIWYYFVMDDQLHETDPPVFLCSSLDLAIDHGIPKDKVVGGDFTLVSERFTDFLWPIIGQNLCLRNGPHDEDGILSPTFCGMTFKSHAKLDERFATPETRWFQYDVYFADEFPGTICSPTYGAVFADVAARDRFASELKPKVQKRWAEHDMRVRTGNGLKITGWESRLGPPKSKFELQYA